MKNNIKSFLTITSLLLLINCDKDSCEYIPTCTPFGENGQNAGLTVVTYNADNPSDFVGAIYDTRNNASAPVGNDWAVTLTSGGKIAKPTDWTLGKIGRVFGIAIDDNANVYLASSGIYGQNGLNLPYQNTNPGRIYKAAAGTYATSTFVDLPMSYASGAGSLNGIGNIAYDKVNKQLFASNLDDGKIYRISMAGAILQTYDPWTADSPSPDITVQDERVWGLGVNYENGKVKLYFARITTPVTTSANRNLYSITLNTDGSMSSATPNLEISNLPGIMTAITDIEFSGDTKKVILAERGDPHNAIAFSYTKLISSWVSNTQYSVGGMTGKNSAGGVDFSYKSDDKGGISICDDFIWASGNFLEATGVTGSSGGRIYGLQGIKYTGNTLSTAPSTDIFIDYNPPIYGYAPKGDIGDVDVFDANNCFCISK